MASFLLEGLEIIFPFRSITLSAPKTIFSLNFLLIFIDFSSAKFLEINSGLDPSFNKLSFTKSSSTPAGLTSHLMDEGIDTGPIIDFYKVSPSDYSTLGALRNEISLAMPFLLINSCIKLLGDSFNPIQQEIYGRQYYFLHKRLVKVLNTVIRKNGKSFIISLK